MILVVNEHDEPIYLSDVDYCVLKKGILMAFDEHQTKIGMFKHWSTWTLSEQEPEEPSSGKTCDPEDGPPVATIAQDQVEQLYTDLCTRVQNIVELRETNEQATDQSDEYYRGITNGLEVARAILLEDNVKLVPKRAKLYQGDTLMPFEDMPNPTESDLEDPFFNAVFNLLKTWDINIPQYYAGYCSGNGSHVKLIINALQAAEDEQIAREDADYAERRAEEELEAYNDQQAEEAERAAAQAELEAGEQAELGCSGCGKAMSRCICPSAALEVEETPFKPIKRHTKKGRNYNHTDPSCPFYWHGNDNVDSVCCCAKEAGEEQEGA